MITAQCFNCKNYMGNNDGYKCKAFPKEIPSIIITGAYNHKIPYDGDNGILFDPIKKEVDK